MGEKGHNQTLGKSGKTKGFLYPDGEHGDPAGAAVVPFRCRKLDHSRRSRRTGRALVNPAGAAVRPLRYRSDGLQQVLRDQLVRNRLLPHRTRPDTLITIWIRNQKMERCKIISSA